jgi:hypothetical protein
LARWDCGPFLTDDLADLKIAQRPDQPGAEDHADGERRQRCGRGAERDVARHIQRAEKRRQPGQLRQQVEQHQANSAASRSATMSVRMPRDPLTSTTVATSNVRRYDCHRVRALREVGHGLRRHPGVDRRIRERARRQPANGEQRGEASRCGGAPTLLMQCQRVIAELEHLAEDGDLAFIARLVRDDVERAAKGRRARVVRIVDERDAAWQARHHAAAIGGAKPCGDLGDHIERDARIERHGRGRKHVRQIPSSQQRRLEERARQPALSPARACRQRRGLRSTWRERSRPRRSRRSRSGRQTCAHASSHAGHRRCR